jgi:hypothetical protein
MEAVTADMTPEEKTKFKQLVPKSDAFVEELSDDDKLWLKKVANYSEDEKKAEF